MKTVLFALLAACTAFAQAQSYPTKPVQVIISFTPASATDIVGRIVTAKLAEYWGQPIVNENRSGAGGAIGDRKSTRLNSSHIQKSRMPSSA